MGTDDTSDKNPESPGEYQNMGLCHPAPALPVPHRRFRKAPLWLLALRFPDSEWAQAFFSCPHEHYTIASASPVLPDKFCKGCSVPYFFPFSKNGFIPN